jgi:hypothetical protein
MRSARSSIVGKPCTEGFGNHNTRTTTLRSSARLVRYVFSRLKTLKYSPDKAAGAVHVKYVLARRVRTDQRWDAGVGAGGGHPGSCAREGRSVNVGQRSRGRTYPSRGVGLDTIHEKNSRGERSGTVWRPPPEKIMYGGFWLNLSCPTS